MDWEKYNNKTPIFTLERSFVQGKIVDVYDGDTVKIVLNLPINSQYFRWNCRLSGINTPEIRTKNIKEKEFGLLVRDKLKERIENKILLIKCGEFDKYGRLLVEIYENQEAALWSAPQPRANRPMSDRPPMVVRIDRRNSRVNSRWQTAS